MEKIRYMVYDPTELSEPQITASLYKAKKLAEKKIMACHKHSHNPRDEEWVEGVEDIIIAKIIYRTKKIKHEIWSDFILEREVENEKENS